MCKMIIIDGTTTPFLDALFRTITSICVTDLVVENTFAYWSTFCHVIILLLIMENI